MPPPSRTSKATCTSERTSLPQWPASVERGEVSTALLIKSFTTGGTEEHGGWQDPGCLCAPLYWLWLSYFSFCKIASVIRTVEAAPWLMAFDPPVRRIISYV